MIPMRTNASALSTEKNAAIKMDVRARNDNLLKLSLMIICGRICQRRKVGEFICQLIWLMDQNWQALRTDIFHFTFESQVQERRLLVCSSAIEAGFIFHDSPVQNRKF